MLIDTCLAAEHTEAFVEDNMRETLTHVGAGGAVLVGSACGKHKNHTSCKQRSARLQYGAQAEFNTAQGGVRTGPVAHVQELLFCVIAAQHVNHMQCKQMTGSCDVSTVTVKARLQK